MTKISEVVIVGAGQAGMQTAVSLRMAGYDGKIRLIGDEPSLPYQRPPLSKAFLKRQADATSVQLRPQEFYKENAIDVLTGVRVATIDRAGKRVIDHAGQALTYDRLVLATGVRPRKLEVPGAHLTGIHYLRSVEDAEKLLSSVDNADNVAIIGGGFIGLEAAACLAAMGKSVVLLETASRVMGRAVAPATSAFFQKYHESLGIRIVTEACIAKFNGELKVNSVELADGTRMSCDIVLVGIGALANSELAETSGIKCANGILVNSHAQTSDSDVYAVGDCARYPSLYANEPVRVESVQNAIDQSKVAAANLLGGDKAYDAVPWFWSDQGELKLQTTGLSANADTYVIRGSIDRNKFSVFHLRNEVVIAVDSVNAPAEHMLCRKLVAQRVRTTADELMRADLDLKSLVSAKAA